MREKGTTKNRAGVPLQETLMRFLDRINAAQGEDELLGKMLHSLLYGRKWVRLPRQRNVSILVENRGSALRFTTEAAIPTADPLGEDFLRLANVVNAVGKDRVRRCQLKECGRWFIARKGQQYCTYVHSQRERDRRKQEAHNE